MSSVTRIRHTDSPFNDPVQSPRFIQLKCNWFFLTREQGMQGPFASQQGAETALQVFLSEQTGNASAGITIPLAKYPVEEIKSTNVIPWKQVFRDSP